MREVGGISIWPIAYCAWSSLYLESYQGKHCHSIAIIHELLNYICRFCTEHAATELCIYTISSNVQTISYLDFPALIASA